MEKQLHNLWNYSYPLKKIHLTLKGHSRGSERSGFYIPELKIMFDAGIRSYLDPKYIFITHCHSDHSSALPMILDQSVKNEFVCVPEYDKLYFKRYCNAYSQLNAGLPLLQTRINIKGVRKGDIVKINKDYFIKVFPLSHTVCAMGYGLYTHRKKLLPEVMALERKERIAKIKKGNCFYQETKPQLAYVLDTSIEVFEKNPELLTFPVLILECTFLCPKTYRLAQQSRHIHWTDLEPYVKKYPKIDFILCHFSMRYSHKEIKNYLKNVPKNVHIWLH